ncbi:isopentenyl-diphosphate Delta-isomerase [Comamonadaceae bacterium OS-4]|nr:isopentenyl-diphosphate Delta-isomerase [Comamonadaceae bacterium OS-4]
MSLPGARAFAAALTSTQREFLADAGRHAKAEPPLHLQTFWISGGPAKALQLGCMEPERAGLLATLLPDCQFTTNEDTAGLHWHALAWSEQQRSAVLQAALEQCHARGLVHGWRNEAFAFWHHDCLVPPNDGSPPLLAVERAGFRFLGMRSHAVHINGFTPDGRLWCGRRSLTKATDPGLLDNVTAGGLPAGESPLGCALRELQEEAGVILGDTHTLHDAGLVRTARVDTGGWHDETLLVYNLACADDWAPTNQDGEVAGFVCLSAAETLEQIQAGAFTQDAVASLAQGLDLL